MYLIKGRNMPLYALLFRILGLMVAISAITLELFSNKLIGKGFMSNHVLAYFTIQTNILTAVVFLVLIIKTLVIYFKEGKIQNAEFSSSIHLACTFYITITMTGYWVGLAPFMGLGKSGLEVSNTLFLHLFTPLMAIIDCLLFMKHGTLKKKQALYWLAYPVAYLISVVIIANVSDVPYYKFKVGDNLISMHYPYPFLEPQIIGNWGLVGMSCALILFCVGFGLLYIVIDNAIAKKLEKTL